MTFTRTHTHFIIVFSAITVVALALAGCGMREKPKPDICFSSAATISEKELPGYSTKSLQTAADSLYLNPSTRDRACLIYRIIALRYKEDSGIAGEAAHANLRLWKRYATDFRDIATAMDFLNTAADICETNGLQTAEVDYAYAISYQGMGNHTREAQLYRKALDFYEEAFKKIQTTGETGLYGRMVSNYLTLLYSANEPLSRSKPHLDAYINTFAGKPQEAADCYNLELLDGLTNLQQRRYGEAAAHFRHMRRYTKPEERKQSYMSFLNEATALQQAGRVRDALTVLDSADSISATADDNEMLVSLYFTKSKYWEMLGDSANSNRYFLLYCQVRDSLLSYNQITGLRKAEFSQSMLRMGNRLSELEYKMKVQTVVIIASGFIILLVLVFALIIRNRNRVLHRSNRSLYEQNKEVLAAEKRERTERYRFAELVEELRRNLSDAQKEPAKSEKYSSRKLAGNTKEEIHDAIVNALETRPELFSSDFSLARLSELCGSRQEYVSQVINETFGCNFNELINKYRVREACRRIDDWENYGQFTLAAIASGVGMDSATTFSKYFKKVTGLTPSQYRKNSEIENSKR